MVLPQNLAAAVLSILLRRFLRRLSFLTILPVPGLDDGSIDFSNLRMIIASAGTVCCSGFYYFSRNQRWRRRNHVERHGDIHVDVHNPHNIIGNRLETANTRINNYYPDSRTLQQSATLFLTNRHENSNFSVEINTQPDSRFTPSTSLIPIPPSGPPVLEIPYNQYKSSILLRQASSTSSFESQTSSNNSPEMINSPKVIKLTKNCDCGNEKSLSSPSSSNNHNLTIGSSIMCKRKPQNEENSLTYKRTRSGKVYGLRLN